MEGCTYTYQPRPSFRFLLSLAGGHDGRTGFHAAALMKDCGWCCEESYTVHAALAQLLLGSSSGVSAFFNSFIAV